MPRIASKSVRDTVESIMDTLIAECKTNEDREQLISYWLATGLLHQQKIKKMERK